MCAASVLEDVQLPLFLRMLGCSTYCKICLVVPALKRLVWRCFWSNGQTAASGGLMHACLFWQQVGCQAREAIV